MWSVGIFAEMIRRQPLFLGDYEFQRLLHIFSLRFHLLGEFDEGKKSCRKRLDGHNRRRRKPQPKPMLCSGSFLSNYQGAQLLPFSGSCVYPSTTVVNPTWAGVVKAESDPGIHNQHLQHQNMFLGSLTSSRYNKGSGNKQQFTLF